jgi:hypothetical protein
MAENAIRTTWPKKYTSPASLLNVVTGRVTVAILTQNGYRDGLMKIVRLEVV